MKKLSELYKKAVVTGASSGLGKAFSQMLLSEGIEVFAISRNINQLEDHPLLHKLKLDLADLDSTKDFAQNFFKNHDGIHLVINNAGYGAFYDLASFPEEHIQDQLFLMLQAPILLCKYAYREMKSSHETGVIVNVSSLAAHFPIPYMSLYNAAKSGLSSFSKSLQLEAEACSSKVKVIDFQPGDIRTDFNSNAFHNHNTEAFNRDARTKSSLSRCWEKVEKHLQNAPSVNKAVLDLKKVLLNPQNAVVRTGSFFQAKLSPFLAHLSSWHMQRLSIRRYYDL